MVARRCGRVIVRQTPDSAAPVRDHEGAGIATRRHRGGIVFKPRTRRGRPCDEGAAAVEFALISLLLFLLLFGLIEFGIGFFTQQGAAAAAREAARRAAVGKVLTCNAGSGATDLKGIVKDAAGGSFGYFDTPPATMTKTDTNGDNVVGDAGDTVVVTIKYHVDLPFVSAFVPGISPTLANLTQTGTARIEQQGGATTCS